MDEMQIRRSWLLVPMSSAQSIVEAAQAGADVVVLDLVELVAEKDKDAARNGSSAALQSVCTSGAHVYAQVNPERMEADLRACVWKGLTGVVVSRTESA